MVCLFVGLFVGWLVGGFVCLFVCLFFQAKGSKASGLAIYLGHLFQDYKCT